MHYAIDVKSVYKRYGDIEVLKNLSLSIEMGEFFGLLGPNGAGKTTLISIIAGLVVANSGCVSVMGNDVIRNFGAARRSLGVVPQELAFDAFFTVRETLKISSGFYGVLAKDEWIDELLDKLDLLDRSEDNMRNLSGGMKRRVLVAQALVHRPPVIILDEPTAGVDVDLRHKLWDVIKKLNEQGHTIVLTTHYFQEVEELCGRIAVLRRGEIVALDRTDVLISRFSNHEGTIRLKLRLVAGQALPSDLLPLLVSISDKNAKNIDGHSLEKSLGEAFLLKLSGYAELESILAILRLAGCRIEDMEIIRADLEDVFMQLVFSGESSKKNLGSLS